MKPTYCFLDTETTGLGTDAEIISIALVFTDDQFRILGQHTRHFMPDGSVHPKAQEKNGYTPELWLTRQENEGFTNTANEWHMIFHDLSWRIEEDEDGEKKRVNQIDLVMQNSAFDMRMLYQMMDRKPYLATYRLNRCIDLASFAIPFMRSKGYKNGYNSLRYICAACDIPYENAHGALADTLMTLNCWEYIDNFYKENLK